MEASEASVTVPSRPPVERPSWLRMSVLTALGVVIGGFALFGVEILLWLTRLDNDADLLRLPRSTDDSWEWTSYAAKAALACWLVAWVTRRCVWDWTDDWDMRVWPVALATALALTSPGDDQSLTLAGCALVVVVARNVALVPRPAPRWRPSRSERIATIAAIVVVAIVALAYRPLHPLSAALSDRRSNTSFSLGAGHSPSRAYPTFGFLIGNDGPAGVTVRSIHAYDEAPADVDVMTSRTEVDWAPYPEGLQRPMDVEHIAHGAQLHGWLQLSRSSCRSPYRVHSDEVLGLTVRYETLGLTRTQRLPIDPPARLRCPARH